MSSIELFMVFIGMATLINFWTANTCMQLTNKSQIARVVTINFLLIVWMLLRLIRGETVQPVFNRYLWLMYHISIIYIAYLVFRLSVERITKNPETDRKIFRAIFWISTFMFILVITNDLHELTFDFTYNEKGAIIGSKYGINAYIIYIWDTILYVASAISVYRNNIRPRNIIVKLAPSIVIILYTNNQCRKTCGCKKYKDFNL